MKIEKKCILSKRNLDMCEIETLRIHRKKGKIRDICCHSKVRRMIKTTINQDRKQCKESINRLDISAK